MGVAVQAVARTFGQHEVLPHGLHSVEPDLRQKLQLRVGKRIVRLTGADHLQENRPGWSIEPYVQHLPIASPAERDQLARQVAQHGARGHARLNVKGALPAIAPIQPAGGGGRQCYVRTRTTLDHEVHVVAVEQRASRRKQGDDRLPAGTAQWPLDRERELDVAVDQYRLLLTELEPESTTTRRQPARAPRPGRPPDPFRGGDR